MDFPLHNDGLLAFVSELYRILDGNDVMGTITVKTGANPNKGSIAKLIFKKAYSEIPRVVLSPSNEEAAGLSIFKGNTTKVDMLLNAKDVPLPNTTYIYDYFIGEARVTQD